MRKKRALTLYNKLLLSFSFVFLLPYIVFVVFIYTNNNYIAEAQRNEQISADLDQLIYDIETKFESYATIANQLQYDESILSSYTPLNYTETRQIQDKLWTIQTSHSDIYDIWYHNVNDTYLISGLTSSTSDWYASYRYDLSARERDLLMSSQTSPATLLLHDNILHTHYIIHRRFVNSPFENNTRKAVIIFQINPASFLAALQNITDKYGGSIALYNSTGQLILSYPVDSFPATATDFDLINLNNEQLFTKEAPFSEFTVHFAAPHNISAYANGSVVLIAIVTILLVIGFIVVLLISRYSYVPIKSISNKVSGLIDDDAKCHSFDNELEYINNCIDTANREKSLLKNKVISTERNIIDYLVFSLLRGKYESVDMFNADTLDFGIHIDYNCFSVVVIRTYDAVKRSKSLNCIKQLMHTSCNILERISDGSAIAVLILPYPDSLASTIDIAQTISDQLQTESLPNNLGFSNTVYSTSKLGYAYVEALISANKHEIEGDCNTYSNEYVNSILTQLNMHNYRKALDIITDFKFHVSQINPAEEKAIVIALQECVTRLPPEVMLREIDKITSFCSNITSLNNALGIVAEIIDSTPNADIIHHDTPIEQMYSYIENKYADPDFSLKQMAQYYSMSVAQLSGYFKRETAVALNDYISNLKMDKAKQLLTRSTMSVNDIGMSVGYVNCNSFVRRFKQLVGMTPGEYRKFNYVSIEISDR